MIADVTAQYGEFLEGLQTGVIIYWGTGRSGKTGKLWADLDDYLWKHPVAFFRYPKELLDPLGNRYRSVKTIQEIHPGDIAVFDDAALYLMARNWGSGESKNFVQWLSIISHKDILAELSVQSLRLLDVLVFEPQSVTLVQKFVDWEAIPLERPEYQAKALIGNLAITQEATRTGEDIRRLSYVHRFGGVTRNYLVPWWSDKYSKPYREVAIGGS